MANMQVSIDYNGFEEPVLGFEEPVLGYGSFKNFEEPVLGFQALANRNPSRVKVTVRRGEHWLNTTEGDLKVTFGGTEIPAGEVNNVPGSLSVTVNGRDVALVVTAV